MIFWRVFAVAALANVGLWWYLLTILWIGDF